MMITKMHHKEDKHYMQSVTNVLMTGTSRVKLIGSESCSMFYCRVTSHVCVNIMNIGSPFPLSMHLCP